MTHRIFFHLPKCTLHNRASYRTGIHLSTCGRPSKCRCPCRASDFVASPPSISSRQSSNTPRIQLSYCSPSCLCNSCRLPNCNAPIHFSCRSCSYPSSDFHRPISLNHVRPDGRLSSSPHTMLRWSVYKLRSH